MTDDLRLLRPYRSFIVAKIRDPFDPDGMTDHVLEDIIGMLRLGDAVRRQVITRSAAQQDEELEVGYIHFREVQSVTWTANPSIADTINHLVVICRRNRHVAVCVTDASLRSSIARRFDRGDSVGLGALQSINPGLINAAFVRGKARTLWLSATHRRTTVKADSKVLSGIDLRDALSPVEDQSYYFTAARCGVDIQEITSSVGSAPRSSKVWVGSSEDWNEFRDTVTALLTRLEQTKKPEPSPLPVIAVTSIDSHKVKGAFDLALVPPELATEEPLQDDEIRRKLERWSYGADFEVLDTKGPNVLAKLSLNGKPIGKIEFEIDVSNPERVTWRVRGDPDDEDVRELHDEALELSRNHAWLKVWYDSGHALSNRAIFEIRYRDMPFRGYDWGNFGGIDVTREKPEPLAGIGEQDSLFCWIKRHWPISGNQRALPAGWLACDDGAMEIADFIHLDDRSVPPVLSLIHVKGAGSNRPNRGISVSKFEVVTGQAVKNLRSLDRQLLDQGMADGIGRKVGALVWHDRRATTRHDMLRAIAAVGADYERRVIVVQPHLQRTAYEHARQHPRSRDAARLRQLDALLLGAESAVHGAGSVLVVTGER